MMCTVVCVGVCVLFWTDQDLTSTIGVSQMVRCQLTLCVWVKRRWWRKGERAFQVATLHVS